LGERESSACQKQSDCSADTNNGSKNRFSVIQIRLLSLQPGVANDRSGVREAGTRLGRGVSAVAACLFWIIRRTLSSASERWRQRSAIVFGY
jgi:hypothetical protein